MNSELILEDYPLQPLELIDFSAKYMYQKILEYSESTRTVEVMNNSTKLKDRKYFTLYLRADRKSQVYHREGDKLLSYIGDIGGMMEAITTLGIIFSATFVSHSMTSQLINEVYQVQQYTKEVQDLQKDEKEKSSLDSPGRRKSGS